MSRSLPLDPFKYHLRKFSFPWSHPPARLLSHSTNLTVIQPVFTEPTTLYQPVLSDAEDTVTKTVLGPVLQRGDYQSQDNDSSEWTVLA